MLRSPIAVVAAAVLCMPLQAWNGPAQAAASASLPVDTPRTTSRLQQRHAAWAAYAPARTWPLKTAVDGSPRDDWDQIGYYDYETSANDKRSVGASLYRRGDNYTVAIVDMDNAVAEKRGSQERMIFDRLLPKGYTRKSFAGKTAHSLDTARVEMLKQSVEDSRKELDVPGVAIGLIDHGKVVLEGGFGARESGKADAVDCRYPVHDSVKHQSADHPDARAWSIRSIECKIALQNCRAICQDGHQIRDKAVGPLVLLENWF